MNDYTLLLIVSAIACCSLIAILLICLHFRRLRREYNMNIVKQLHEKDRVSTELERTRLEKEVMEKVLKINLSETVESSVATNKPVTTRVDCEQHVLRIDITYLE